MKIKIALPVSFLTIFFLSAVIFIFLNNNIEEKNTPIRVGTKGIIHASIDVPASLEEVVYDAEYIFDLTITEWLGESFGDVEATYFSADVNNVFKGERYDKIVLKQDGNSKWTVKDYPLFKNGDRLFVFLKKVTNEQAIELGIEYENVFWISGAYTTIMDVQEYNSEIYLMDRYGLLTENIESDKVINDKKFIYSVEEEFKKSDLILAEVDFSHKNIIYYDNFTSNILAYIKEEGEAQ